MIFCDFWGFVFILLEIMKKKMIIIIIMKKKKILGKNRFWATVQLYCENKIKLYCNIKTLLQAIGCRKIFVLQGLRRDYIAIGRIVLQG